MVQAPKLDQPFEIKAQNPCNPWEWRPRNYSGTGRDPITNCEKGNESFWGYKEEVKYPWKTLSCLNYNQPQISGTREGFYSHGTICHKTQKQTEWWKCALIVIGQYYKHHWKTVLNLFNNSLTNCAGTNSNNFTMILSFFRSKSHSFQNSKKRDFPGFFSQLPETRVLKFNPELETLIISRMLRNGVGEPPSYWLITICKSGEKNNESWQACGLCA